MPPSKFDEDDDVIIRCFALFAAAVSYGGITTIKARHATILDDARKYESYLKGEDGGF